MSPRTPRCPRPAGFAPMPTPGQGLTVAQLPHIERSQGKLRASEVTFSGGRDSRDAKPAELRNDTGTMQSDGGAEAIEQRVLVLMFGPEAEANRVVLDEGGFEYRFCSDLADLLREFAVRGGAAVVLTESDRFARPPELHGNVAYQPSWSDLPMVLLSRAGAESPKRPARSRCSAMSRSSSYPCAAPPCERAANGASRAPAPVRVARSTGSAAPERGAVRARGAGDARCDLGPRLHGRRR